VVGTGLPQPIALVTLSENGRQVAGDLIKANLERDLSMINQTLDAHEQLEKIIVIPDAWTVENGMLTPTFKLVRNAIENKYNPHFEKWYDDAEKIIRAAS
jgi:long-subunit acyl-CoA synthetase (AMP-forming)